MTVLGLINFISYVATKIKEISHYSKLCRNPFKELLQDNNMRKVVMLDQSLAGIQNSIHNIMGPLSTLWVAAEEEKVRVLADVDTDDTIDTHT